MESLPLHQSSFWKWSAFFNRSHTLVHIMALSALFYYRLTTFIQIPSIPWLLILASELILSFQWLMKSAFGFRPVTRTAYPERLPHDEKLPAIDVFVCTADPEKEPPLEVMNTVISAMALDYPPERLSVYLSDDGGSDLTLSAIHEAWNFGCSWIPFCRKYRIKNRCPKAYFTALDEDDEHEGDPDFRLEKISMEREYWNFMERLKVESEKERKNLNADHGKRHPPNIQIIGDRGSNNSSQIPFLVYVSREKDPSCPHHFKAGALNVLFRVSGLMSNAPYILVLDCDMYCNDPSSARQAMCFHLDKIVSPSLAFVQFPQRFHNVSKNDIYDSALRSIFEVWYPGMEGIGGPILSGTGFYIKRKALYVANKDEVDKDLSLLRTSFGSSNEFIKLLNSNSNQHVAIKNQDLTNTLLKEAKFVASCFYEEGTQWGKQIGFLYNSVVEDFFTGFNLHCSGWKSVYYNPSRPAFLGTATTNLSDTLVQGTRWMSGLFEVFLSKYCPILYGINRMPLLLCMCYTHAAAIPLACFPVWCFAVVPQLCLFRGIPVYPKVSSPWFILFTFVFLSPLAKDLCDVLLSRGTIQGWWNDWRIWMIKSVTSYSYGCLDAFLKVVGKREASFMPTNKVADEEQVKKYEMGLFDFQASTMLLAPLVTLTTLNMASLILGAAKVIAGGLLEHMFGQTFLPLFILAVNYPIVEGMLFRRDQGRIPLRVTLQSTAFVLAILSLNSIA